MCTRSPFKSPEFSRFVNRARYYANDTLFKPNRYERVVYSLPKKIRRFTGYIRGYSFVSIVKQSKILIGNVPL